MTQPLMHDWSDAKRADYGQEIVRFRHRLDETGLFTDEALAKLFDKHPVEHRDICTMQPNPPPGQTWIAGEANGLAGAEIVEAVRRGHLWASARSGMVLHPEYKAVFDAMMGEFGQSIGLPILTANASILVSGAKMGIFFHVDPAETMLWHVRGTKTINIYPRTDDYIPETALEAILLKETLSDCPWRDEMAAGAVPVTLNAGEAVAWPQHGPHNVINGDNLNVSVSVEYNTPASALLNGVFYTNGVLRRRLGLKPTSRGTPKALQPAYWAAAKAIKRFAPPRHNVEKAHPRQFDVDLNAPGCIRWREGCGPVRSEAA
jgi:hypothetical protein